VSVICSVQVFAHTMSSQCFMEFREQSVFLQPLLAIAMYSGLSALGKTIELLQTLGVANDLCNGGVMD
jgi:hypothetical protein